ncbi:MAG: SRPBCC family protein [Duncaniella sp.]|nr:SRPBCC family protein [Duncaniella sp.]
MSQYKGKSVEIARPIAELYAKVSDLGQYQSLFESVPEEQRKHLQGVKFGADGIAFQAPGVGDMKFKVAEKVAPNHVGFVAEGSPIPIKLSIELTEKGTDKTEVLPVVDVDLPAMLRPFVGPKLQEAADQFGSVFTKLFEQA